MSITTILGLFGGAQVVLLGLMGWLGKFWLERTLASERHAREQELERLKADQQLLVTAQLERLRSDLARQQAAMSASLSAAGAASSLAYIERFSAIQHMWRAARCH